MNLKKIKHKSDLEKIFTPEETKKCPYCGDKYYAHEYATHISKKGAIFSTSKETISLEITCLTCRGEWIETFERTKVQKSTGEFYKRNISDVVSHGIILGNY